jgi:hypothetical protein
MRLEMIIVNVNEAENFFKHAHRDHDITLDCNPDLTELLIIDACAQYKKLTSEEPPLFIIYRVVVHGITQMLSFWGVRNVSALCSFWSLV